MSLVDTARQLLLRRQFRKAFKIEKRQGLLREIYQGIDGYQLSKAERGDTLDDSLTYGEIAFEPFTWLLSTIAIDESTVFYDLGSGVGKAVVTAAMHFPFKACHGIECLPSLHQAAMLAHSRAPKSLQKKMTYHQGDFLEHDISDANLTFINASGFFGARLEQLVEYLKRYCQPGTQILISSKSLPDIDFFLAGQTRLAMAFGPVTVNQFVRN